MSAKPIDILAPVDHNERDAALDPTRSFCVTAPAGSGKTELLSQRVLALLAHVQQPEEILAITFTRKAAAEMRERILLALHAAQADEPGEEHKRKTWRLAHAALLHAQTQQWNLLQNPQRLRVQTIDGLCGSLTAQMPVLSQFGGQPRVTDRAQPLYREAIDALLLELEKASPQLETAGTNKSESDIADCLGSLLQHLDNRVERLHELLAGLLACRDQWLPHIFIADGGERINSNTVRVHLEKTLRLVREDALARVCECMLPYQGELLPLLDFAAGNLQQENPAHALCGFHGCVDLPADDSAAVEQWKTLATWLLTNDDEWRKSITKNQGFPAAAKGDNTNKERKAVMQALLETFTHDDALLQSLVEVRTLPAENYSDSQWQLLLSLTRVLVQAVAQLRLVFQVRGEVDFTEISMSALQALGSALNPTDLMLQLDQRTTHLLIDEFQDTSSTQFRLLERLVEGWHEQNENGGAPRTLFIVGDGMQSIYGFREAKVGLFLEARDQGVNALPLVSAPLQVNFRSTPTVVNWNNRVFEQAFPRVQHIPRGAVRYEHSRAFKSDKAGSEVKIFGVRNDPDRIAEAQRVVELVQSALHASTDGEVAILVRNRSHLRAIVPALQRAGIAFRATDIDPLVQRAHVQDLLALLKALLNPADRVAWLALLRSPLIGLDNCELHLIANGGDGSGLRLPILQRLHDADVLARLSANTAQRLRAIVALIDMALQQRQRKPLRSWLEGVWIALGGDLLTPTANAVSDIRVLLDLIEQSSGDLQMGELEERLRSLYARPENTAAARVVVMTIHKSKGLEFDTVIVPALDAGSRANDKPLLRWSEYLAEDGTLGIAMAANQAIGGESNAIYEWLEYEGKQQSKLEDTRLLYVAATRAIARLYLVFRSKDAEEFKPTSNSLLNRIWSAVSEEVIWSDAPLAQAIDADSAEEKLSRVPLAWHAQNALTPTVAITENPPASIAHSLETMIGTALHKLFELLARYGADRWQQHTAEQRRAQVVQVLRQVGVVSADIDTAAAQVMASIERTLSDTRGGWLFSNAHREAVAEWELLAAGKRYVIDRSFVEVSEQGETRWIIDYKNSIPHADESIEQFTQRETQTYRAQLQLYGELVAAFDQRPIRTALYFPRIAQWVELSA
ncbi:MAG: UvrD-helicase domain-containing protein [Spongiibacteraceae bacterium]